MEPNDVDCVLLFRRGGCRDRRAFKELRDGLPFLDIALVFQKDFDKMVNKVFASDRHGMPKGMSRAGTRTPYTLASLSDGRTVIQDDRKDATAAWYRLREFLATNPGLAITGLRHQGVNGRELTMLSHQQGYFFGFKGQAIVGGPQQHYVGVGYFDGRSVIINWLALPQFHHQYSEQRSREQAGFMLIELPGMAASAPTQPNIRVAGAPHGSAAADPCHPKLQVRWSTRSVSE